MVDLLAEDEPPHDILNEHTTYNEGTMTMTFDTTVGRIAAVHPETIRIFERYGLDFCCGGDKRLSDVCEEKSLDSGVLVTELRESLKVDNESNVNWVEASLSDLVDHIVTTYHRSLDEELPRLLTLAEKVCEVHRAKDPERLPRILAVFQELKTELEHHMMKEERILFPMIKNDQGPMGGAPISVMMHEHESAGSALRQLRELTDDFSVPTDACNTWTALWRGLEQLEMDLHQHIHLENNILFPRALNG